MSDTGGYRHWSGGITTYTYDVSGELLSVSHPSPPGSSCEHDEKKRVFRMAAPDGQTARRPSTMTGRFDSWSSSRIRKRER